jgi:hypothetical protein
LDGVLRDPVRADVFNWNSGAVAGGAGAKFAAVIVAVDFVSIAVHAAVFASFGLAVVRSFRRA